MRIIARSLAVAAALLGLSVSPSWCATPEQDVGTSDQSLAKVLAASDRAAAARLLDAQFVSIDADGQMRDRTQALANLAGLSVGKDEKEVQSHFYGTAWTTLGDRNGVRFLRVWVKRPQGWKVLVTLDTPVVARPRKPAEPGAEIGDCDNPCRRVPFTPHSRMDQEILAMWQKTKVDEWHHDADDWVKHIADEFMIINNATVEARPERVALAKKEQADKIGAPGAPVTKMQMIDFPPSAAVMLTDHVPYGGGRPYHNVRVFIKRDGDWQLAISQQTSIKDAAVVSAESSKSY